MAIHRIPTSTDPELPHYVQRTALEGTTYVLRIDWNQREQRWYLRISDEDGNVLAGDVKVVANWPLLRRHRDERLPPGSIMAIDQSGKGEDPGLTELGERVLLLYFDAEELS